MEGQTESRGHRARSAAALRLSRSCIASSFVIPPTLKMSAFTSASPLILGYSFRREAHGSLPPCATRPPSLRSGATIFETRMDLTENLKT